MIKLIEMLGIINLHLQKPYHISATYCSINRRALTLSCKLCRTELMGTYCMYQMYLTTGLLTVYQDTCFISLVYRIGIFVKSEAFFSKSNRVMCVKVKNSPQKRWKETKPSASHIRSVVFC